MTEPPEDELPEDELREHADDAVEGDDTAGEERQDEREHAEDPAEG